MAILGLMLEWDTVKLSKKHWPSSYINNVLIPPFLSGGHIFEDWA